MARMLSVITPSYSAPDSVNLQINTEKRATYNINSDVVFCIKDASNILHKRHVLCDDQGNPIVALYKKFLTWQGRWQVFLGTSNDPSQLLFSVKCIKNRSKIPAGITKLNVFLANNMDESSCDFRVVIVGDKMSCTVYAGESPTNIVATMENNCGFNVLVNPNVDYAFIVALLLIVNEMGGFNRSININNINNYNNYNNNNNNNNNNNENNNAPTIAAAQSAVSIVRNPGLDFGLNG